MNRSLHQRVVATLCLVSFFAGNFPARALAETAQPAPEPESVEAAPEPAKTAEAPKEAAPPKDAAPAPKESGASPAPKSSPHADAVTSLPNGVDSTGVSSGSLSLPQGAGKVQGMGESFSNQLSTGTGTFTIPITLPGARGGADASLVLSYSTSAGHGVAGIGWDVGVPFVARQTDRGTPLYQDPPAHAGWQPTQDRFVFNGGQELVPICLVAAGTCAGSQPGEVMPSWGSGWQYFRPRVEGSFLRFFWSPDHRTWRVQGKDGVSFELGAPLDGSSVPGALESDPSAPTHVFRWNITRAYDGYGPVNPAPGVAPQPVNLVQYRYLVDNGSSYVSDIYDTPPTTSAATAPLSAYAHHTHLRYAPRGDVSTSYRRGWVTKQAVRLVGIDVTSKPFKSGTSAVRRLTRRYHLNYDSKYHASLLTSIQLEGRCGSPAQGEAAEPVVEDANGNLPATTSCPTLPPMTFGYTHVVPHKSDGSLGVADLAGYEGFDERVIAMTSSPPHSVDEQATDLFDLNADGLPDVLVTMPALYGGSHGAYFSGASGKADTFVASTIPVQGVNGETSSTITLGNLNVSSGDLDGDGSIDLVHMPQVKTYSVYTPQCTGIRCVLQGRAVTTAAAQSPKINLGSDGLDVQRADVNGDGLVDIVVSTGTEMETFYSLDRYPGGDGQFGHATWAGATTATISNDPVTACVPYDGLPVQLSDSTIKIADMNGDGLPDIVRVQPGDIHYWPGRGNGYWGTATTACPGGTFGQSQSIAMGASPHYADPSGSALRLDDVNGDGFDDLVQVELTTVNVWLNVDGNGWTGAHVIANAPASPSFQNRVRIADMNGSGTRDVLWGDAGSYRYMDLSGAQRPWLLDHVENGLGKTIDLAYASSTSLMLAAQAAGAPWTSVAPMPLHVVTQMVVSDNLPVAGNPAGEMITQYSYRDPVYDGRQREFRGFRTATERHVGDANSPTSNAQSTFLLGDCVDDAPVAGLPSPCTFAGRWRDNPREALKGRPATGQTYDDNGVYQSTTHHTYRLRRLYVGLDGREVRHAHESVNDAYLYDVASGDKSTPSVTLGEVELETKPPAYSTTEYTVTPPAVPPQQSGVVPLHGTTGRVHLQRRTDVDVFGNTVHAIDAGCIEGCAAKDEVITRFSQATEVSGGGGWLWRVTTTQTQGTKDPSPIGIEVKTYDVAGSVLTTRDYLQGTLPLVRTNATGGAVAPAPANGSKDGWAVTLTETYDGFGNALTKVAPNGRCRSMGYDTDYSVFTVADAVFAGGLGATGCGATMLVASAAYDAGFGSVLSLTDLHAEKTNVQLDGFGRMVAMFRPDPATGSASPRPSMTVDYFLPADPHATPYSKVHTRSQIGADPSSTSYREAWAYVDGLGRPVVSFDQADTSAGDTTAWVRSALATYDAKGAHARSYLAGFYSGDPSAYAPATAVTEPYTQTSYDAFGRTRQTIGLDKAVSLTNVYHALSVDAWDAADLQSGGAHYGSYATSQKDGHGRTVTILSRNHVGGALEVYANMTTFRSTGEPTVITRSKVGSTAAPVVRWMVYDSRGRMVANVEPDTSTGFNPNPATALSAIGSWRYAYDDNGELVGTSDARGCGVNYTYEGAGRVTGEDYSPCTADHPAYTSANEVSYLYDAPDPDTQGSNAIPGFPVSPTWLLGRLVALTDRSGKTVTRYDGRGRATGIARRLVAPSGAMAPRWYVQASTYDAADRVVVEQTGAVDVGATALDVTATVTTVYSVRGLVKSVTSDHGLLVAKVTHAADNLPLVIQYADAPDKADVAATTTTMTYDARRRLSSVQTARSAPSIWTAPPANYTPVPTYRGAPNTFQLLLQDLDYVYDVVDNPIEIDDYRIASEWPAGAKPVTRKMQYDDLYRLTRIDYQAAGGPDAWTSPYAAEDQGIDADPQRAKPSPHVSFAQRSQWQTFTYDYLGNTTATADDAQGFYDRSLGAITSGAPAAGPYQLKSAASVAGTGTPTSTGSLSTAYDAAGNMTSLALTRGGTCLPSAAICSQRFVYTWDEVNRLQRARRWDLASPGAATAAIPTTTPSADLRYVYDGTDDRAIKAAYDASGNVRYAVYPLDALELRGSTWTGTDYERDTATQVAYLLSHGVRIARLAVEEASEPTLTSGATHLLLEVADNLGSSSIVFDRDTSELVERGTYQAYGAAESDYRPQRWNSFREDYRFTGKEEDIEVGLHYFGKRYYSPQLQRWVSADPLNVHSLKADANLYAYVGGAPLRATDPTGLEADWWSADVWKKTIKDVANEAAKVPGALYDGAKETVVGTAEGLVKLGEATSEMASRTIDAIDRGDHEALKQVGRDVANGTKEAAVDAVKGTVRFGKEYVVGIYKGDVTGVSRKAGSLLAQAAMAKGGEVGTKQIVSGAKGALKGLTSAGGDAEALGAAGDGAAAEAAAGEETKAATQTMCFVAGTMVLMGDRSLKPIEDVEEGDEVLADDPLDARPAEPRRVTQLHRTATYRLFHLDVGEGDAAGEVVVTGGHPFWTERGWVTAEELSKKDFLTDDLGRQVFVRAIAVESRDAPTFNLSIEGTHTFFVVAGRTPVLVHNVDPWDIKYTQNNFGDKFTDPQSPWNGRSVAEAIAEARKLGRLPDGLQLRAVRTGDGSWAALNNRTLAVARGANLPNVNPVDAGAKGHNEMMKKLKESGLSVPTDDAVMRCD